MLMRKDYIQAGKNLHRAYYAQFITPEMEDMILKNIGLDRLMSSIDKNLNDIDLSLWDSMMFSLYNKRTGKKVASEAYGNKAYRIVWQFDRIPVDRLLWEAGDMPSLFGYTCIFKECAKRMVERIAGMSIEEYQARVREVNND